MSDTKDWKIMVYLAGDNNLGEAMVNAITGMKRNLSLDNDIALYAYYDSNVPGYPSMLFDFTKKDIPQFAQDADGEFPTITDMGRDFKTSAASVYKFVEWCMSDKKPVASKHALILSGHGDAFQKDNFLKDGNNNGYVSLRGLSDAIGDMKRKFFKDNKLSILGLDCCVMSSVEIAYQMQPYVEYLLASQGLVPDRGWDYSGAFEIIDGIYSRLREDDADGVLHAEDMCRSFADSYVEANRDVSDFSARSVDISYCNLELLSSPSGEEKMVVEAIYALAGLLEKGLRDTSVSKKIASSILSAHWSCQTYLFDQCIDIADFAGELRSAVSEFDDSGIFGEIGNACVMVEKSVWASTSSKNLGAEYQWSNGLSVFFPWSFFSYKLSRDQYRNLDFALDRRRVDIIPSVREERKPDHWKNLRESKSAWLSFLDTYLHATLREVRPSEFDKQLIMGLSEKEVIGDNTALLMADISGYKVNDPYDKVNDPYDKVNDPRDRLTSQQWENFRRFKNFPWAPREWKPPSRSRDHSTKDGPDTEAARA